MKNVQSSIPPAQTSASSSASGSASGSAADIYLHNSVGALNMSTLHFEPDELKLLLPITTQFVWPSSSSS